MIPFIFFLLALFPARFLFSQTDEGEISGGNSVTEPRNLLEVRIETSEPNPEVNIPWSVYVLVNHSVPSEVNVKPPRFPPSLVLERVRTETRLVRREAASPSGDPAADGTAPAGTASGAPAENTAASPAAGETPSGSPPPRNERWTRVEFLFMPMTTGTVTVDSFEVTVPGRRAVTSETTVRFRAAARGVTRYTPRLRWISVPSVPPGKRGNLLLELSGWDPQKEAPRGVFWGRAPLNAVLEEEPPLAAGEGMYHYTITVIPLEESDVEMEPFSLRAEGFSLDVPGVKISVLPAGSVTETAVPPVRQEDLPESALAGDAPSRLFPNGTPEKVFFLFREDYNRIVAGSRALWEESRRAEALAEIRLNERDSLPGPYLVSLRREMEQSLGLDFTEDENWRPLKIPLFVWLGFGLIIVFCLFVMIVFRPLSGIRLKVFFGKAPRKVNPPDETLPDEVQEDKAARKTVTSQRLKGFKTVIVLALSAGLLLIVLGEGLGDFLIKRLGASGSSAVLERTPAYRVPDYKGTINARFGEGQPVRIGGYQGDWCYAESSDGRSGWIPRQTVITY